MSTSHLITPAGPTAKKAAKAALGKLLNRRSLTTKRQVQSLPAMEVPSSIADALAAMLSEYAEGHKVVVTASDDVDDLSTTEAARLLGMSRPTFINILEAGDIQYRMVGSHRRVRVSDIDAYKENSGIKPNRANSKAQRLSALRKMAVITNASGHGY